MTRINHALHLHCSSNWSDHNTILLRGHMDCLRGVQGKFEKFKSGHEFRNRWEVALEPKRLEFLLNRGEILGIAKAIVTFDRLQKA